MEDVSAWVKTVQRLRYKDFQLVARPAQLVLDTEENLPAGSYGDREIVIEPGLKEIDTMREFGMIMKKRKILQWWRKGLGYTTD